MMIFKESMFACILIILFSCQERSQTIEKQKSNQIILIFNNAPVNNKFTFKNGLKTGNGGNHEVSYIDDHHITRLETLNYTKYDTIVIKSKRRKVEITLAYKGLDKLSYVFHNGDSVLFTYDSSEPWATVLNREVSDYTVNYELKRRTSIGSHDFPENVKFFNPIFFNEFRFNSGQMVEEVERVRKESIKDFETEFRKELVFLDSLYVNGLISEKEADYYKTKRLYNFKIMSLQSKIGPSPLKPLEQELSNNDLKLIRKEFSNYELQFENDEILDMVSDSLLYYSFYDEMLNWFLHSYYSRKVGRVKTSRSINGLQASASNLPDYKTLYDTIFNQTIFSKRAKKALLLKNMELLIPQSTVDDTRRYYEKFKKHVQDSIMINYLAQKYNLDYQPANSNGDGIINNGSERKDLKEISDLYLVSMRNGHHAFNDLLSQLSGKVVYVDFWASWCKPCIDEIPYSKSLQKSYKDKDVAFVYLSTDTNNEQWKKGIVKYELDHFANNYMIANLYSSKQFESLDVKHIPRYLLYDRKGNLVHGNAPRPSESKIRFLLDKHLSE